MKIAYLAAPSILLFTLAACGGTTEVLVSSDAGAAADGQSPRDGGGNDGATANEGGGPGIDPLGIGEPCVPVEENQAQFLGFSETEVALETETRGCRTHICLVNHFRGRVSCPYGQDANGAPPLGATACVVPGTATPVTGEPGTSAKATVKPQCLGRKAADAVYCSCRCANVDGRTDDGATYCPCGSGFTCTQLVSSIGSRDQGLTGGYCVKNGSEYNVATACLSSCDPSSPSSRCE